MVELIELGYLDVNPITAPAALCVGTIFSGAVEAGKIEQAWATVGKAWPILGACVRLNHKTEKIEMVVPDPADIQLKVTSKQINSTLAQTEQVYIKTNLISTQAIVRDSSLYHPHPLQDLNAYIANGDPIWSLHVTYLMDATILAFTFPHLMDGGGMQFLLHALIGAMDGRPVPPAASNDPWTTLLSKSQFSPDHPTALSSWSVWDEESVQEFQQAALADMEAYGPLQPRIIYFPATEIERLKRQGMEDIRTAGHSDIKWLSTSDVLSAWFYQHLFIDLPDSNVTTRFVQPLNSRKYFPEVFLPDHAYIRQAFFFVSTDQLTNSQLHSMSFGEIARIVRLSTLSSAAQEPLLAKLRWICEHDDKFIMPFSPGDRLQITSSWLAFGFGDLDISSHVKAGTGTGRLIETTAEGLGKGSITVLKFKDADGGIVCEMDWGVKRWTSGEIAKYALENRKTIPDIY
ncbi:hypothetical protein RhiJN_26069 [Ceratobasidium sp. AG-Ba]|nr:hypothetical protein RhiJN_26069 [Ceratobasidium sp. AG-Ba]